MSTTPSIVGIWNRALQLLGASRVQATDEGSSNSLACLNCYESLLEKLQELHVWRFAIKLASLPEDNPKPAWGKGHSYTLPADYVDLAPPYDEDNTLDTDWEIQDGRIFTNDGAPLKLRYVAKVTDPVKMSPSFRELLSTEMAVAMCEELTQSNAKKQSLKEDATKAWAEAKRANSRQTRSQQPPQDPFITSRR